ncbi:serine/threonine-protein phosphatase [Kitasatospora sp. NBC_00240]|uniref:PP2C family protein-serine/threonine phosphatase n=1 Tax=Kitasatospora sp. NBC_00240 TaxID=2903567 RepID=UPI00224D3FAA|nr:SpoIIE family protein phosphatase [Kitasatospora sp. NBC_00240]MCX5215332.1 serine/threonine-protein phosphatase [Kitasatospora sp. NBC_00240]
MSDNIATLRLRTETKPTDVRAVADTVQKVPLGPVPSRAGAGRIAHSHTSAAHAAEIGGDLHEAVTVPGGVRITVADIQSKGLPAVRGAAVVPAAFRQAAPHAARPSGVDERIEQALKRRTDGERLVTAVLAEVGDDGGVRLLNFGHPAPPIRRGAGSVELAEPPVPGPPLGLDCGTDAQPGAGRVRLRPGDRILFPPTA